jgi:hypothetical protein
MDDSLGMFNLPIDADLHGELAIGIKKDRSIRRLATKISGKIDRGQIPAFIRRR